MPCGSLKRMTTMDSSGSRDPARDKRVGRIDRRHALEVDVGLAELRADVAHIVGHAAQDRLRHGFGRIAARGAVAVDLLSPFEVDDRNDADLEVGMLGDVHLVRDDRAMQSFVEQEIAASGKSSQGVKVPAGRRHSSSSSRRGHNAGFCLCRSRYRCGTSSQARRAGSLRGRNG